MQNLTVEELPIHGDARGVVVEPLGPEQFPAQRNCHLIVTEPGGVRGNHFHERGTEVLVVLGPALVRVRENGGVRDLNVETGRVTRFTFPPRVSHAIKNIGVTRMLAVSFNTSAYDPAQPDVTRDVLIE
jgi:UDP-2-acetamido-2,6-beta-L-arabino-hexul-4-ose reductase